ncbi:HNH endonuclease signature motif containing protein [Herbiconiux sp.]|uniref:HNH endonuclease signature motif containing protein n=1 Tax=Herbiconiux sp. TaxID=1871186 RepID=UPI0025BA61FE|nr:HNH endonuclease signature motif containing protein [Herbiconiux sp.]
MLVHDERDIAAGEARRARHLAIAAAIADQIALAEPGDDFDGAPPPPTRSSLGRDSSLVEWGRRSLAAEIGCALRRPESTITRLIGDAEHLADQLPGTLAALETGEISYQHARKMVAHAQTLPREAQGAFERDVLPVALVETAARFDDHARRVRESSHPESIIDRATRAKNLRGVWLEPGLDGMATLHHHLPAVDAVAIDDLIDRMARNLRTPEDTRTLPQRRSDVLTDIILGRDGTGPRLTPTVIVTVPARTIAGDDTQPGDLHGYGPIDPDTARELSATAPTFLRALTAPDTGQICQVTRRRYRPTAELRTVLTIDDQTCRFPGCRRRATACELDHTVDWADGGPSTPENLAHLCPKHHHLKHSTAWRVEPDPTGNRTLHWTSPGGATYTTTPTGRPPTPPATPPPSAKLPRPPVDVFSTHHSPPASDPDYEPPPF